MKPPRPTPHPVQQVAVCASLTSVLRLEVTHAVRCVRAYLLLVPVLLVSGRAVMTTSGGSQHTDCAQAGRLHLQDITHTDMCRHTHTHTHRDLGPNAPCCIPLSELTLRPAKRADRTNGQCLLLPGRQAAPAWWLAQSQVAPLQAQQVPSTHPRICQGSLHRLQDSGGTGQPEGCEHSCCWCIQGITLQPKACAAAGVVPPTNAHPSR